jgi:hypothetical protein
MIEPSQRQKEILEELFKNEWQLIQAFLRSYLSREPTTKELENVGRAVEKGVTTRYELFFYGKHIGTSVWERTEKGISITIEPIKSIQIDDNNS